MAAKKKAAKAAKKPANAIPAGAAQVPTNGSTRKGGSVDVKISKGDAGFMGKQKSKDKKDTKARHANGGLESAKTMIASMAKGVSYATTVEDLDTKLAVLTEVADTAAKVADDARLAVRNARAEKRNMQA